VQDAGRALPPVVGHDLAHEGGTETITPGRHQWQPSQGEQVHEPCTLPAAGAGLERLAFDHGEPLRVIAGQARGRRISAPPGVDVRPTSDRVREALFSMLEAHLGGIEGLRVADLACGSGALGIEALSRGARSCCFVDIANRSLGSARANLAAVGLDHAEARFVKDDLVRWAGRQEHGTLDLVLVDPPYVWDRWAELLDALVGVTTAAVAESDRDVAPRPGWASLRTRRHGGTVVSVLVSDRDPDR